MALTVNVPPGPDLASVLQNAVSELAKVIESKPDSDKLLAEMVRLCGQSLKAGGAAGWVTESPDKPDLILEHTLANLQLIIKGVPIPGVTVAVRRCAREAKP